MGRGYIVDDLVEKYLVNLQTTNAPCTSGLLIGQCSPQRDFVVLAVRTPRREGEGQSGQDERTSVRSLEDVDAVWVTEHARQVSRMLPGGLCVLGLFLITHPDLSKEAQNTLRKLIFAVEKVISKGRLWSLSEDDVSERVGLHICSKTRKAVCRTFDVRDPKTSAKPADWKYQPGVSDSWPVLQCSVELDLNFPTTDTSLENQEKSLKVGLQKWAKQIESSVCLINGRCSANDFELMTGQKKNMKWQPPNLRTQIIIPTMGPTPAEQQSSASVQVCDGSLGLRGVMHCRAYVHGHKPRAKQAAEAIKRDIINSVSSRTEMFFEDLLLSEGDGDKGGQVTAQQCLPRRVFAAVPSQGFCVCDYMFPDEGVAEVRERFAEMLDREISEDEVEVTQEVVIACSEIKEEVKKDERPQLPAKAQTQQKGLLQYVGVAAASAIALLAFAASLLYLSD